MPSPPKPAKDCMTMQELRAAIDGLDAELVQVLVRRAAYIDRAAELKLALDMPARIDQRIEEVVANVRRSAEAQGLDAELAEGLWRRIIDWSIAREEAAFRKAGQKG
ncbi:MAG: chorismate mutase [Paracoccaceae bacterium]